MPTNTPNSTSLPVFNPRNPRQNLSLSFVPSCLCGEKFRLPTLILLLTITTAAVFTSDTHALASEAPASQTIQITLPKDELPHPKVDVEWWYYSGHLKDETGQRYGVMASFFVFGAGNMPKMHFAIAQLSDKDNKKFHTISVIDKDMIQTVKAIVGGLPQDIKDRLPADMLDKNEIEKYHKVMPRKALVAKDRLALKYGSNEFEKTQGDTADWRNWAYATKLTGDNFNISLNMRPTRGPMYVGGTGNVAPEPGVDMYYYSFPRMDATGTLVIDGSPREVTGTLWYDHQFGAFNKDGSPIGWDWFCVQLEDGTDMNISTLRDPVTGERTNPLATVQLADGSTTIATDIDIKPLADWTSPGTGFTYPQGWEITIPSLNATIRVQPDYPEQEMRTFGPLQAIWEGSCNATATINGKPLTGDSYTELVGYNTTRQKK